MEKAKKPIIFRCTAAATVAEFAANEPEEKNYYLPWDVGYKYATVYGGKAWCSKDLQKWVLFERAIINNQEYDSETFLLQYEAVRRFSPRNIEDAIYEPESEEAN